MEKEERKAFLSREPRNNRPNKYSPSHEGAGKGGNWLHKAVFLHLVLFHVKFWLRGALLPSTHEKKRGMEDCGDEAVIPLLLSLCLCNEGVLIRKNCV